MGRLSTLMNQSDPGKAGAAFSERELEVIKRFASAQAHKEAVEAQNEMNKSGDIKKGALGAVAGFFTGGVPGAVVGGVSGLAAKKKTSPLKTVMGGAAAGSNLKSITGGATTMGEGLSRLGEARNLPNTGKYFKGLTDPDDYGEGLKPYKAAELSFEGKEKIKAKYKSKSGSKTASLNAYYDDFQKAMDITSTKGTHSPGQIANSYYNLKNRAKSEGIEGTDLVKNTDDEFVSKMSAMVAGSADPTKDMKKLQEHAIFKKNPQLYSKVVLAGKEKEVYEKKFGGGWFGLGKDNPNQEQLVSSFVAWAKANKRKGTDADYEEFLDAVIKGKADIAVKA